MDEPLFSFVLATCQRGAELALRREVLRHQPLLHPAYGRSGFVTFKATGGLLTPNFELEAVFARTWAFSLGKLSGASAVEKAREAWQKVGQLPIRWVHVWPVDPLPVGDYDFEPRLTEEALEIHRIFVDQCPYREMLATSADDPFAEATPGDWVLDCVLVRKDEWFLGVHRAHSVPSRYAGGLIPLHLPAEAVSRAYLKMEEALRWAGFPLQPGGRWLEIGCAPGGSAQALLAHGQMVLGVDPADVDPRVLAHPNFNHIKKRISQVPRRLFRKIRWLTADMNVAPNYTLEVVESIVLNQHVSIRGMILTLKLLDWQDADRIDQYLERIRGWGFNRVRARQLQFNRQEFCVAALQVPFRRKPLPDRIRRRKRVAISQAAWSRRSEKPAEDFTAKGVGPAGQTATQNCPAPAPSLPLDQNSGTGK
jgi:23S rRNA (cytidine2498-2'-O)-methyltransferase